MCFKNVLSKLLEERGLKQTDLVNLTGIPSSLISNYIKGVKSPGLKNALKIANALGVSLEALSGKEELKPLGVSPNNDEATAEIERLVQKYGLTAKGALLLRTYFDMSPEKRAALENFVLSLTEAKEKGNET